MWGLEGSKIWISRMLVPPGCDPLLTTFGGDQWSLPGIKHLILSSYLNTVFQERKKKKKQNVGVYI
jgi:hypothetical protein